MLYLLRFVRINIKWIKILLSTSSTKVCKPKYVLYHNMYNYIPALFPAQIHADCHAQKEHDRFTRFTTSFTVSIKAPMVQKYLGVCLAISIYIGIYDNARSPTQFGYTFSIDC